VPTRSGVLCRAVSASAAGFTLGIVPVTDTWIVKDVGVYNAGAVGQSIQIVIANQASTIYRVLFLKTLGPGAYDSVAGWFAAGPNDSILVQPGAAAVHVWVSGADLQGHL
jgi:hypothetical protein